MPKIGSVIFLPNKCGSHPKDCAFVKQYMIISLHKPFQYQAISGEFQNHHKVGSNSTDKIQNNASNKENGK